LTIYLSEADQWHGRPLYLAIIQLLQNQGYAGATASRALAGYGAGVKLYESRLWPRFSDAIIVIEVIDRRERLERLRPCLEEMLCGGLMTLHDVEVLKYTHARRRKFLFI
jgi:PII-like signaling protein